MKLISSPNRLDKIRFYTNQNTIFLLWHHSILSFIRNGLANFSVDLEIFAKGVHNMNTKLDLLKQIASGMAKQFGPDCEIVIHDLTQNHLENSIVHIENGHVSGRYLGDGPSPVVLETFRRNPESIHDKLAYLTRTSDGKVLKSSTMFIRDDDGNIDYILAVNYDITGLILIDKSLKAMIETESTAKNPSKITHNVNDLLDELLVKSVELVGKPVTLMSKDDKIHAIQFLNDAGAFLITRSGDKVSKFFGISKYTLYSYIDVNKNVT